MPSIQVTITSKIAHHLATNVDEDEMMVVVKEETKAAATDGLDVVDRAAVVNEIQVRRSTTAKFQLGTTRLPA